MEVLGHGDEVVIVGAGIAGLTLGLELAARGMKFRILEACPRFEPLGVGINIQPHAAAVLFSLGLGGSLCSAGVVVKETGFYNEFGQVVYSEPAGRHFGFAHPQVAIHRGELHDILLSALVDRVGESSVLMGTKVESVDPGGSIAATDLSGTRIRVEGRVVVGADGVHSAVRRSLHGPPVTHYTGYMMWRGTTIMEPFLTGATVAHIGWLDPGKLVIYPIKNDAGRNGRQLLNWVAEVKAPMLSEREWNRTGRLDDFARVFDGRVFDWLDVPAVLRQHRELLQYPMVDQVPLESWSRGCVTLVGDAAHAMVPRGSNGAAQAIVDVARLGEALGGYPDVESALAAYESERRPATTNVVLTNRVAPPDLILKLESERSQRAPHGDLESILPFSEIQEIQEKYRAVVGLREG